MIAVTKTFLPPINEYTSYLESIWREARLTNFGPLTLSLQDKIKSYLQVENIILTNNGTVPLQIALKLLGGGEIVTTPFSYVATTSAIVWERCEPVYADIDPEFLTIDENKIEDVITENTTAILATHVFGNPCNVEAIERIASKYDLRVIYDAAHCFGVRYQGQSIFNYGDVSSCSFHATKLFHTGEGGAIFCKDHDLNDKFFYSHNFGHNGPLAFHGLGINGKISELQSAMGLAVLPYIDKLIAERKLIVEAYHNLIDANKLQTLKLREGTEWNYSYFPVIFESETKLLSSERRLNEKEIFPRRYFYPSLNTITYTRGQKMPVAESIARRILCLPLFSGLEKSTIELISDLLEN